MKTFVHLHQHDIVRGIKGAGKGVILIWLFALMGCSKDWVLPKSTPLPFNDFWFSTKFGEPAFNASAPYYFNSSAQHDPYNTGDPDYRYIVSDNFEGTIPIGCARAFSFVNNIATASIDCTIPRTGTKNANNMTWKESLSVNITLQANAITKKITYMKIYFHDYNQTIDLTNLAINDVSFSNGGNTLLIGNSYQIPQGNFAIQLTYVIQ